MSYRVEIESGKSHANRSVAFLISENNENKKVTAKDKFENLDITSKRSFRTRFDYWISGQRNKPSRYHGWDKSEYNGRYTKCFVFKYKIHRLYGFLCNPQKEKNIRFEICILVVYAKKKEHETDETNLKNVEQIRTNIIVHNAIRNHFKEKK